MLDRATDHSGALLRNGNAQATCFLHCMDDRAKPRAWDENGRTIEPVYDGSLGHEDDHVGECGFNYGGPPNSAAHELLTTDQFEERIGGFQMIDWLVVESRWLLRQLPLRILPVDAVSALPDGIRPLQISAALRESSSSNGDLACTPNYSKKLFVAPVAGAGHGLFAAVRMDPFAFVGEYAGLLVEDCHATEDDTYRMNYPAADMHLSARTMGNLLRFANHATGSEATLDVHAVLVDGAYHMVALANRRIESGEQLTLDYGGAFWRGREAPLPLDKLTN